MPARCGPILEIRDRTLLVDPDRMTDFSDSYVGTIDALSKTRGFIVSLPVHWTEGEMNRFAYPTSMVAHIDGRPIVEDVFSAYGAVAQWRWSDEATPYMAGAVERSYCCQYRETDLDFVQRLLTEEGLAWRFEQSDDGAGMVLFADSTQLSAVPEDPSSELDGGIRFHNVRAGEQQDTVQALRAQRQISASLTTVLSYDYKAKQAVSASMPSRLQNGSQIGLLESYDVAGQYAYARFHRPSKRANKFLSRFFVRCVSGRLRLPARRRKAACKNRQAIDHF